MKSGNILLLFFGASIVAAAVSTTIDSFLTMAVILIIGCYLLCLMLRELFREMLFRVEMAVMDRTQGERMIAWARDHHQGPESETIEIILEKEGSDG